MTALQSKIKKLRSLCEQFNIHTLCALERALYVGEGLTQQELADKTKQTKQAVGRWEKWMEVNGLLVILQESGGHKRNMSYTNEGVQFIKDLSEILFPEPSTKQNI